MRMVGIQSMSSTQLNQIKISLENSLLGSQDIHFLEIGQAVSYHIPKIKPLFSINKDNKV